MQDLPSGKPVVTDTTSSILDRAAEAAVRATPDTLAKRMRGLSDRIVAWIFIAPTIVLLLAINIFPLIWAIQLSVTNYRANRPNEPIKNIGFSNYSRILNDTDTWIAMQATAHFVFWTILLQTVIGFSSPI
jgi:multiple sugar transport system permease protein